MCVSVTFCLDPECGSDQGEQRGVEHHRSIAVQRHVHGHQALHGREHIDQFETKAGTFPTVSCQLLLAADSLLKMSRQWFDTTVIINVPPEMSVSKYLKYFLCAISCQRAV